jgi:hypothetical protein
MAHELRRAIRIVRTQIDPLPGERCQALIQVERPDVGLGTGTAEGGNGTADILRSVARATADALSEAYADAGVRIRVRGVQQFEAFAQQVVVVSLVATKGADSRNLLGVCDGSGDLYRATALAVLNGTNRFLGLE